MTTINAAGRLVTDQVTPPDTFNGWPYVAASGAVAVTLATPYDTYASFAYNGGKLLIAISELPPVNFTYNSGFLVDAVTGALLCNLTLPPVGVIQGLPVEANGTLCIA